MYEAYFFTSGSKFFTFHFSLFTFFRIFAPKYIKY